VSDTVIRVENLSKKYILGHQQQERYTALRDVISNGVKSLGTRLRHPGRKILDPNQEEFWALKDVSFEIKQGDRVGVIGRNGAGKSTLLKILSQITEPTKGQIRIKGRIATLLEVGTGFHPELTGRENIYLNGAILGMSKEEITRKFDEIVAFAEVEKFLDTPVKRYSSGMYVRLAFSVAAHLEPEILIVDEVLAVGDAEFQKKCLGKMEEVGKNGKTVLFVSHNMAAIQVLCTKAICLKQGSLIGSGDVAQQIESYLNTYRNQVNSSSNTQVQLSKNLTLKKFDIAPNPLVSSSSAQFVMTFFSSKPTCLEDISILIYSSLGMRVALLDLRQSDVKYQLDGKNSYTITVTVNSFSLIEGDYRIGLYIRNEEVQKDFLDLASLTVIDKSITGEIIPYPSIHRGVVDFTFRISSGYEINV
jgi:lipopolysaccharide transport system ATP-binding protein